MIPRVKFGAILVVSLLPYSLWAVEADDASVSVNGFGTLGILHSDYEDADFVTLNPLQPTGVGHSRRWGMAQDTKLGVQVRADVGRFAVVVQGVSQLRYDNSFKPVLEWANLEYAITPELKVRVGRFVLPTFLSSDTENVGYARPWVRTPGEIRVQLPLTNSDGADLNYQFNTGNASHRLRLLVGHNKAKLPFDETFENKRIRALSDTIEYGNLTVHLAYQRMVYQIEPNPEEYSFEAIDFGFVYDPGDWYIIAERFSTFDDAMGDFNAHSLGGGYRIGDVTPYLIWSRIRQSSIGELELEPLLNQRTIAVGMRWDFARNMALKLQYETIKIGSPVIPASFINMQPGLQTGDHAQVFSATLDFVW